MSETNNIEENNRNNRDITSSNIPDSNNAKTNKSEHIKGVADHSNNPQLNSSDKTQSKISYTKIEKLKKFIEDNPNLKEAGFDYNFDDLYDLLLSAKVESSVGNKMKAVYLLLAAYYSQDKEHKEEAAEDKISALKDAWNIAVEAKQRALGEIIFDLLKDYLDEEELTYYGNQLNELMFAKLKEIGFKPNDLIENLEQGIKQVNNKNISNEISNKVDLNNVETNNNPKETTQGQQPKAANNDNEEEIKDKAADNFPIKPDNGVMLMKKEVLKYKDLVGFSTAVNYMRDNGLNSNKKNDYMQLVNRLNEQHGLDRVAFNETLIFKSVDRSDAKLFMEATAGEIGMPCMVMHMDENIQGASVLSMVAPANANFRLNPTRTGFNGKGIIILEDIDTWNFPEIDVADIDNGMEAMMAAQMSRGILEVINLIDIALHDPNIIVMANIGSKSKKLGSLHLLFNDYHIIDINLPCFEERKQIWKKMADDHPSLRVFNLDKLSDLSKNMSRYSIEVAAHEALEDAYKQGLEKREFVPLGLGDIIKKLANHQPLESFEYKTLEDAAADCFKQDLKNIDDILN